MQCDPVISAAFKTGYHHAVTALCSSCPPLDYNRILPITIKAGLDNADLLADLIVLFPEHTCPDQMARIIEHSDKVGEVSNQIKSKIYCMLDRKTAFGKVRMIFVTNNFKKVESFLNNGNTWKQETSLHKGLLYMLQNFQASLQNPTLLFRLIQTEVLCPSNFRFSSANLNAFVYVNY
ncbi:hypothetical protein EDD18DRAFT_1106322 [Armillaria luteobubalina]|uniref:Uncharacterized protein n=1 Tax=Armillaria luteobubalina TaxID=153913 RepID=A0AA39UNL0_9AGAR|nr:hypothetical protein EDD18DRAFT_1106322 [Armillaria luteobubalina]